NVAQVGLRLNKRRKLAIPFRELLVLSCNGWNPVSQQGVRRRDDLVRFLTYAAIAFKVRRHNQNATGRKRFQCVCDLGSRENARAIKCLFELTTAQEQINYK